MKFERLKKNNIWKWIGILLIVSIVVFVVTFTTSRSKYRYTSKTEIVNGVVHYQVGDLEIASIYLEQSDGSYIMSDDTPTSGYVLNTTNSSCKIKNNDGTRTESDATISYHDGVISVDNVTKKGTICDLYFDIACGSACQTILANNTIDTSRSSGSFSSVFTDDTSGKIFQGPADDYGDYTLFFAGSNPSNWVYFAGYYWRIIRINGNGSIRLIYNGSDTSATGSTTQISTTTFNSSTADNAYVGYMYGTAGASTYSATHKNTNSSTIKGVVDSWYSSNLTSYASYLDTNIGFCGDRSLNTGTETWSSSDTKLGYGTNYTMYGAYGRLLLDGSYRSAQTAIYTCPQSNDLYTVSSSSYGNKALTYPVGLITFDEVLFAGALKGSVITGMWLWTNSAYWTMTPWLYNATNSYSLNIGLQSGSSAGVGQWNVATITAGARPVINLKASVTLTGSGTTTSPYKVS